MNFIFWKLKNLKKTLLPRPLPGSRAKKEANLIICTDAREKIFARDESNWEELSGS